MRRCAVWIVRAVLLGLLALAAAWTFWAVDMGLLREVEALPASVGNRPEIRAKVPDVSPAEPFTFAVVGDLRADETFDAFADALRGEKLAFLALAGDITREPTRADHRFVQFKMRKRWRLPFPVFCLPGNHDVDPETYPLEEFEKTYGETLFTLTRGPYRFILLRMLPGDQDNGDAIAFLARELADAEAADATVFVIGHCAPKVSSYIGGRSFSGEKELRELLEKHRVRAYIHGDYHAYCRTTVGPTTYLCVGGGGANLRAPGAFSFHHVGVISIEGGHTVERLCVLPAQWRADERGRYLAAHAFERFGIVALVVPLGIGVIALAALGLSFRSRRSPVLP